MLDHRVWALISPTIKKLETLFLQMPVTATHTSQFVNLAAICGKTPELWVVKNRFFFAFFSGFSAIYFHLYLSLVEYDFSGFQHVLVGSICYRFWEFARNRFLKSFQKSVQSDPYKKTFSALWRLTATIHLWFFVACMNGPHLPFVTWSEIFNF